MSGPGEAKSAFLRIARVVVWLFYAVVAAYSIILGTAFVLRLLGASPTADFVEWIYRASAKVMQPFRGMFPPDPVTGESVFDASLLFAVIVYSFAAALLHGLIEWLTWRIYQGQVAQQAAQQGQAPQPTAQVPPSRVGPAPSPNVGAYGQGGYGQGVPPDRFPS